MFGLFLRKKEVNSIKEETKKSFESVKKDINAIGSWIKHLDSEKNSHKKEIDDLKMFYSTIRKDVEELKNIITTINRDGSYKLSKQNKYPFNKQGSIYSVQTAVQTAVQTPNFDQFSITEKAIIWVLLNTEMKLSYEDIATMLRKEKSTIRGQINSIKQKSNELIEEQIEKNGKKRVFITENIKENILKKIKK